MEETNESNQVRQSQELKGFLSYKNQTKPNQTETPKQKQNKNQNQWPRFQVCYWSYDMVLRRASDLIKIVFEEDGII